MSNNIDLDIIDQSDRLNGKSYEDFVEAYWNNLVGPHATDPVDSYSFNFAYVKLQPGLDFRTVVNGNGTVNRKNFFSGNGPINTVNVPGQIPKDTPIFVPRLDACFYASKQNGGYKDEFNQALTEPQMRFLAKNDIDTSPKVPPDSPTIEKVGSPSSNKNIVQDPNKFRMEVPSTNGSTFRLKVDNFDLSTSILVNKMEHLILPDQPGRPFDFQAVAVGYYVIFKVQQPGRYIITNLADGANNFKQFMRYTIHLV